MEENLRFKLTNKLSVSYMFNGKGVEKCSFVQDKTYKKITFTKNDGESFVKEFTKDVILRYGSTGMVSTFALNNFSIIQKFERFFSKDIIQSFIDIINIWLMELKGEDNTLKKQAIKIDLSALDRIAFQRQLYGLGITG